jgi:hypothetical protein
MIMRSNKMTQSFDEWKEEQERIHNDYDAENAWYAGAQSKQAEIDELRKRIDEVSHKLTIIKNSDFRPHHHEYDKGWRDCDIAVLDGLKGTTNEQ